MCNPLLLCLCWTLMQFFTALAHYTEPPPNLQYYTSHCFLRVNASYFIHKQHIIPEEFAHHPALSSTTITSYVENTLYKVPGTYYTPDYRLPEQMYLALQDAFWWEENRPYRFSPANSFAAQRDRTYMEWNKRDKNRYKYIYNDIHFCDYYNSLGCFCCTVYQRMTPLAGCAVLSTRHIVTTASSTELVIRGRKHYKTLENVLGYWYEVNRFGMYNNTLYATPARIHYHPQYIRAEHANRTHPLPCVYDLAIWVATYPMWTDRVWGDVVHTRKVTICSRYKHQRNMLQPPTPTKIDQVYIIGYQFMWTYNRVPTPFHRYVVRIRIDEDMSPRVCPKTEWGWFHCIAPYWSKMGLDSGAGLYACRTNVEGGRLKGGFMGMNAISMRLRSRDVMNYFTVVNTWPVLDFFYDAFMGKLQYQYLDYRFYDTKMKSPVAKPWFWIPWKYEFGSESLDTGYKIGKFISTILNEKGKYTKWFHKIPWF